MNDELRVNGLTFDEAKQPENFTRCDGYMERPVSWGIVSGDAWLFNLDPDQTVGEAIVDMDEERWQHFEAVAIEEASE